MIGGYLTFNGVGAQGKWWATPVQDVLPVEILPYDDRMEHCEGVHAEVTLPDHPHLRESKESGRLYLVIIRAP